MLTTNHPQVPTDARNTAWKMVELALSGRMSRPRLPSTSRRTFRCRAGWARGRNVTAEVTIHIEKNLPVQGGLGAGSANAAAALNGLEHELRLSLSGTDRMELAAEVGSDVPLFLLGGAVMGTGRGECVSAMPDLPATRASSPCRRWESRRLRRSGTGTKDREQSPQQAKTARRGPRQGTGNREQPSAV